MQIVPNVAVMSPMGVHASTDVVSPNKLFALASSRFGAAIGMLDMGGPLAAPNAYLASVALREAKNGVGALKSILVPSTPWGPRQTASTAMVRVKRAMEMLELYQVEVAPRGDGPVRRSELAKVPLLHLDNARSSLLAAINVIS